MAAEDWIGGEDWDEPVGFFDEPMARRARPRRTAGAWTTARGETIPFRQMEHTHLLNTIAWIERQYRQLQDTFNQDALDIDLLYPEHAGLVAEARRRRLIPRGKSLLVT